MIRNIPARCSRPYCRGYMLYDGEELKCSLCSRTPTKDVWQMEFRYKGDSIISKYQEVEK